MAGQIFSIEEPDAPAATDEGRWARPSVAKAPPIEKGKVFSVSEEKPAVLPDVLKSVASQGALGLVADTAGLPGSLGQLYDMAARAVMKHGVLPGAEAMGVLPQGYGNKFLAERDARKTQAERDGDVNTIFGIPVPTSQGAEKLLRKHLPNLGLDYEPLTPEGKFAGSAARFAGSSLIPGMGVGATVAKRALLGAAAGAGSEAAGRVGEKFGMEGLGRVVGAVATPALLSGLGSLAKPIVKPEAYAREKVVNALASDMRRGSGMKRGSDEVSPAMLDEAAKQGVPVMVADMGAYETRKLGSRFGYTGPEAEDAFKGAKTAMIDRAQESGQRMSDLIMKQHGSPVMEGDPAKIEAAIKAADRPKIDALYQITRSEPTAQALASPILDALSGSRTYRAAMRKAASDATDPGSGMIAPTKTTPGNLAYYDQVKKNLDDLKETAGQTGRPQEAKRIGALVTSLRDELDTLVPAYRNARDVAAESFGKRNAVELGYSSLASGNAFDTRKLMDAYKKYDPNQQELFRQGVAAALAEKAQKGGPKALLKVMEDPQSKARLRETFGQTKYDTLHGQATRDHTLSNLEPLQEALRTTPHPWRNAGVGAAVGAGASIIRDAALGFNLAAAFQHGLVGAAGAGVTRLAAAGLSAIERRVGAHVMKLLASNDPAEIARLGADASRPGATRSFLAKMNSALTDAYIANYKANPPNSAQTDPDRPRRASGGRARKNHAAEADRLVALVPSFRKAHASQTESLLKMPDAVVAKALAVADGRA
jgi:hypothetical protein